MGLPAVIVWALVGCPNPAPSDPGPRSESWSTVHVPPAPAPSDSLLDLGERLYGWNCFPCHGAEGKGDGPAAIRQGLYPRDFTPGLFKLKTSAPGELPFDADLYRTIAMGIPVAGMPRNEQLDPQDRWALVAYVKSLAGNHFQTKPPTRPWVAPPVPDRPRPDRGRDLFEVRAQCATCHGVGGRGNGPAAAELKDAWDRPARVPDLTRGEFGLKAGGEAGDIYRVLTLGMAGTPMPSFTALSDEDRWDLAAYVRTLVQPISPGERLYLSSGCAACHTIGKGVHVGPDLLAVGARRTRPWLRQWLADPPAMLASDLETRILFRDYSVQMPNLGLKPDQIEALIDFLDKK